MNKKLLLGTKPSKKSGWNWCQEQFAIQTFSQMKSNWNLRISTGSANWMSCVVLLTSTRPPVCRQCLGSNFCNQNVTLDPLGTTWSCHSAQDIATYREAILSLEEDKQWSKAIDILDEAQSWKLMSSTVIALGLEFFFNSQTGPRLEQQDCNLMKMHTAQPSGLQCLEFCRCVKMQLTLTPSPLFIVQPEWIDWGPPTCTQDGAKPSCTEEGNTLWLVPIGGTDLLPP